MVSVFEGQLTRTWFFQNEDKKHVLNLYHDTISGVRSAMLDYQEIRGSLGNSSLLMDSKGHRIFFTIGKLPGYLEIKRSGWTGFEYGCVINDKVIKEVTQGVPENQDLLFQPKILESTFTSDQESEYSIAWYVIHTRRITDGVQTTVHRRFREFAELNSQIKQNMKGHHLRDVLPPLPDKPSKQFTDHKDLGFIQERIFKLENFLVNMVSIPHVANMVCMKAFLGIMDQVREFSLTFHVPTLGMSLLPTERQGESGVSPCVVGMIQKPEVCTGVLPGDSLSRVNGVPLGGTSFSAAIARIKTVPRPMIIHFIQVIGATAPGTVAQQQSLAAGEVRLNVVGGNATAGSAGASGSAAAGSAHRPAPDNILDEVATAISSAPPTPRNAKVLFQGDLREDQVMPAGEGGYQEEDEYAEDVPQAPVVMAQVHIVQPSEEEYVQSGPASFSPVEFVDVDIVEDAPVKKVSGGGKSAGVVGAASGAAVRKTASPATTAPVKAQPAPAATKPAAAAAAAAPAPASAPAPVVAAAPKPAPVPTNPNNLGGVRARVAAMNTKDAPDQTSASKPTVIPVTTAPAPAAAPQSAQLAKPLAAAPTVTPAAKPAPAAAPIRNRAAFDDPPSTTTRPAATTAGSSNASAAAPAVKPVAPTVVRNRSAFEDPPSSAAAAPAAAPAAASTSTSDATAKPATGSSGKNALFANEVPGFSVAVSSSATTAPAAAPAGAAPVEARAAAPVRPAVRPSPAPVNATAPASEPTSVAPTVSASPARSSPAAQPAAPGAGQSSNLLGWD